MKPNVSHFADDASATTQWYSAARHCLVLTLIGLSAIVVAIMLPRDEKARPPAVRATQTPELASKAEAENVRLHAAGTASSVERVSMPFDYFPAQFPAPQGAVEEQPPTF